MREKSVRNPPKLELGKRWPWRILVGDLVRSHDEAEKYDHDGITHDIITTTLLYILAVD